MRDAGEGALKGFVDRARSAARGLLGTWVKLPSLETLELLAHAGFDFVVIDMEHAPHNLERAYQLIFAAQCLGMGALVRLPDDSGVAVQPLLDAGADGLLVPRVRDLESAQRIASRMVFSPEGERGLGLTSRAGKWGLAPMRDYIERGDGQCLRMMQLEDWQALEAAADFAALDHVNGLFIGHGDLMLSSGRPASDPEVRLLTENMLRATKEAEILSGVAVGSAEDAKACLEMGFSLVMLSNDATLFARAATDAVRSVRDRSASG